MAIGGTALAFIAGVLSVLSPCVLPILPIVLGAAASKHRLGPMALAAGLSVSFVTVGLFVATIGHAIGLSGDALRAVAAVLIVAIGAVLMMPPLQARLAVASGPIAAWTDQRFGQSHGNGLSSQFWIGALLGVVWSPLRWANAGRRLAAGGTGPRSPAGRHHHVRLWGWRRSAAAGARNRLA